MFVCVCVTPHYIPTLSSNISELLCYRLRAAKILLIGLDGFGAEIAKNIILAGVNVITFLDHRDITDLDKCSQFFIPTRQLEKCGKNVNIKLYHSLLQIYCALKQFFHSRKLKHHYQEHKT